MAIRIEKKLFLKAYGSTKKQNQIYFKQGKAAIASRNVKVKNQASLSHKLFDLRYHLKQETKPKMIGDLVNIANTIYGYEHKNYGCILKIAYCFNNLFRGRGFHDEKYFINQIAKYAVGSELADEIKKSKAFEKSEQSSTSAETTKKEDQDPATSLPAYFSAVDDICAETVEHKKGVYKILADPKYSVASAFQTLPRKRQAEMLQVWNDLIKAFQDRKFKNKYGHSPYDRVLSLKAGDPVPQYFAHVAGSHSDWERKYLSLCGMRNLLLQGPRIIDDLKEKKFIDGFDNYSHGKGLRALQYYTGNTVDLNAEIDASNDREAIEEAKTRIVNFGKMCGIRNAKTAEQVAAALPSRKLHFENGRFVHDSGADYKDRGRFGIWKRNNHYYVHVPDVEAAIPAILRLPYMVLEMACTDMEKNGGQFSDKFLEELFDNISTKCFNNKLQQLNKMYSQWKSTGGLNEAELAAKALSDLEKNIEKGNFGKEIQAKGFSVAMKEAKTRDDLLMMMTLDEDNLADYMDGEHCPVGRGNEAAKAWAEKHRAFFKQYFQEKGLYKQSLYRTDDASPYVIFDKKVLNECLISFFDAFAF